MPLQKTLNPLDPNFSEDKALLDDYQEDPDNVPESHDPDTPGPSDEPAAKSRGDCLRRRKKKKKRRRRRRRRRKRRAKGKARARAQTTPNAGPRVPFKIGPQPGRRKTSTIPHCPFTTTRHLHM